MPDSGLQFFRNTPVQRRRRRKFYITVSVAVFAIMAIVGILIR